MLREKCPLSTDTKAFGYTTHLRPRRCDLSAQQLIPLLKN